MPGSDKALSMCTYACAYAHMHVCGFSNLKKWDSITKFLLLLEINGKKRDGYDSCLYP